jgi:hypothetical protein
MLLTAKFFRGACVAAALFCLATGVMALAGLGYKGPLVLGTLAASVLWGGGAFAVQMARAVEGIQERLGESPAE